MLPEEVPLHLEVLRAVGNALVDGEKKRAVIVFENLTLDRRRAGVWEFDARDNFFELERRGWSVRIAELRAEYSVSRVDKEISLWR